MKLWAILLLAVAAVQASPIQDESVPATTDAVIHPDDNLVLSESTTPESETDLATTTTTTTESGRKARILAADLQVPAEVVITSGVVGVEGEEDHKGRTMLVGSDGIPIVEGVRMPDDPNDTRTFRNARVINGELVPNESNDTQTGDIYIYGPAGAASGRAINSQSSQDNTFKPSMPYPAFYYQDYYKNGNPDLPDNVGVESVTSSAQQATNSLPFVTEKNSNILQQGYKIHGSSSVNGRPVYYVSKDESAQLHDDRAPYDYEPQQTTTAAPVDPNTNSRIQSYYSQKQQAPQQQQPQQQYQYPQQYYDYQQQNNKQQQQQQYQQQEYQQQQYQPQQYQQPAQEKYQSIQQQYQQPAQEKYQSQQQYPQQQYPQQQYPQQYPLQGNIAPADPGAFVIKQQTYQAGGTTYQIPVPVPKDQQEQYYYNYQQQPYYNQRPNPNPIKQFSNKIKQGIQGGADKIHDFTSPVVDPLTEAGHKISYNLGLAQKFDKFSEKVADPIVAPLVVASAASLALGALGVGFALRNQNVSIGVGSPLAGFSGFAKELGKELQNKTLMRIGRSVEDENGETNANLVNNLLSGLSQPQKHFLTSLQKVGFENWKETPCAKRIFCDVMAQEDELTIGLMEKRMATFLTMMDTGMAESLQSMTQDMMEAIRERKCDQFQCGQDQNVGVSESLKVPNEGPR